MPRRGARLFAEPQFETARTVTRARHGRQVFVEAQLPSVGGPSSGSGRLELIEGAAADALPFFLSRAILWRPYKIYDALPNDTTPFLTLRRGS